MDITLIAITIFIFSAIVFLALFLFNSFNKKRFTGKDGSVFDNQSDLDLYEELYDKTKPLFAFENDNNSSKTIIGFDKLFLTKLTKEGFPDLITVVKYRNQIKLLSDLINT